MEEQIERFAYVADFPIDAIDQLNEMVRLVNEMNKKIGDLSARVWDLEHKSNGGIEYGD